MMLILACDCSVDRLVIGLGCENEDVDQRGEGQEDREDGEDCVR